MTCRSTSSATDRRSGVWVFYASFWSS